MFAYLLRNQNFSNFLAYVNLFHIFGQFMLLANYLENVLDRENKFVPNIRTLLIRENIFSSKCLKNSSEKIYFHERS